MSTFACDHCGRIAGDYAGGSAAAQLFGDSTEYRFCHPNDPDRPDCYHLVTVHGEQIGARRPKEIRE